MFSSFMKLLTGKYFVFWQVLAAGISLLALWYLIQFNILTSIFNAVISIILFIPNLIASFLKYHFPEQYEKNGIVGFLFVLAFVAGMAAVFFIKLPLIIYIRLKNIKMPTYYAFYDYSESKNFFTQDAEAIYKLFRGIFHIGSITLYFIFTYHLGSTVDKIYEFNSPVIIYLLVVFSFLCMHFFVYWLIKVKQGRFDPKEFFENRNSTD